MTPEAAMQQALSRASKAAGRTFPNPAVGAVVYRGNTVLGLGATRPYGGAHAEVVALRAAVRKVGAKGVRGASLAVTLEPCCFTGNTGPCTEAILAADIRNVFVGFGDPHQRVRGRGVRALRRAGVAVETGVMLEACREHHRGFTSLCESGRPYVTLKMASTLDGRIATASGESRWITGPEARKWVHEMRARSDAVMVGSGTALADNPELTARRGERVLHRPVRVLVDSSLRVDPGAKLYRGLKPQRGAKDAEFKTWVLCKKQARGRGDVEAKGAQLVDVPGKGRYLDLAAGMDKLGALGLTTLFVEGGGGLAAALLRAKCVDEIHWIAAPKLIGREGLPAMGSLGTARLRDAITFENVEVSQRGDDVHICAKVCSASRR